MSLTEILASIQYVTDQQGRQIAVQVNLPAWETLRKLLQELEEDERLGQLMAEVAQDERLEGDAAWETYQTYLAEASA